MDQLHPSEELNFKLHGPEVASDHTHSTEQGSNELGSSKPGCEQYELISLIGHGGMGNVYRAKHKELGTEVAVKVIHPQFVSDQTAVKRFEQEAKAASELTHANLVAVYDFGKTDRGSPFLVMDLLDGESMADVISKEGFLDVPRALDLFIQICDALIHAHYKGVVHRDLKPSNILLIKNEKGIEVVKVLDFGIAKMLAKGADSITQTGDVFGSPAYMSPEQCLGNDTDARSDIYSLGCIMYECLTGKLPFLGANPIEMIVKQINETPKLFGKGSNDLNIPEGLESVIRNTLEKDAGKRYQTMEELRVDLIRVKDGHKPLKIARIPRNIREKSAIGKKSFLSEQMSVVPSLIVMGVIVAIAGGYLALSRIAEATSPPNLVSTVEVPAVRVRPMPQSNHAPASPPPTPLPPTPIEIRDIDGKLLYRSFTSADLGQAIQEAVRRNVDLTKANLRGCRLTQLNLQKCKLADADCSGGHLQNVQFGNGNLGHAKFTGAELSHCSFDASTLNGADFRRAIGKSDYDYNIDFVRTNLLGADFTNASFPGCDFNASILTDAKFVNANLERSSLVCQNSTGADFAGARMRRVDLHGSVLTRAKFDRADLSDAKTEGCFGANFRGATLSPSTGAQH